MLKIVLNNRARRLCSLRKDAKAGLSHFSVRQLSSGMEYTTKTSLSSGLAVVFGGSVAAYLLMAIVDENKRNSKLSIVQSMKSYAGNRVISERTVTNTLIALNCIVFSLWKVPSLNRFMIKYFTNSVRSHPITLFSSGYSHVSGWHLAANMIALYSFGGVLERELGSEHFLAFYVSSGLFASGGSLLFRFLRKEYSGSLGASGAIFATVAACAKDSEMRVSFLPLPFISIPIGWALSGCMTYDLLGVIRGWRVFDHAAHLAGASLGYGLYNLSTRILWPKRDVILRFCGYRPK